MRFLGINPGEHPEYIVVGLGNPGKRFDNTRHNIGFKTIDYIDCKSNVSRGLKRMQHFSLIDKVVIGGFIVILAKPQTFMNNSGMAVKDILDYYKMPSRQLIVLYDDAALNVGSFRIDLNGNGNGHNGIKSIIEHLKTDDFIRIRIGVGPKDKDSDLRDFVLSRFTESETKELENTNFVYKQVLERIFNYGAEETMRLFNTTLQENGL